MVFNPYLRMDIDWGTQIFTYVNMLKICFSAGRTQKK